MTHSQSEDTRDVELLQAVESVIQDLFQDQNIRVTLTTSAKDVEGWDSLAHMMLILALEKKFTVKFKLSDLQEIRQVGDIVMLLRKMNPHV